jgi:hypothetical protein
VPKGRTAGQPAQRCRAVAHALSANSLKILSSPRHLPLPPPTSGWNHTHHRAYLRMSGADRCAEAPQRGVARGYAVNWAGGLGWAGLARNAHASASLRQPLASSPRTCRSSRARSTASTRERRGRKARTGQRGARLQSAPGCSLVRHAPASQEERPPPPECQPLQVLITPGSRDPAVAFKRTARAGKLSLGSLAHIVNRAGLGLGWAFAVRAPYGILL